MPAADTDVAQAVPASRGRSPTAPLLLPTVDPLLPYRCHPGRPGLSEAVRRQHRCCYLLWTRYYPTDVTQAAPAPYRGRSPAAPLLVPAADTDIAQAVPTPTVVVHRQRRC